MKCTDAEEQTPLKRKGLKLRNLPPPSSAISPNTEPPPAQRVAKKVHRGAAKSAISLNSQALAEDSARKPCTAAQQKKTVQAYVRDERKALLAHRSALMQAASSEKMACMKKAMRIACVNAYNGSGARKCGGVAKSTSTPARLAKKKRRNENETSQKRQFRMALKEVRLLPRAAHALRVPPTISCGTT